MSSRRGKSAARAETTERFDALATAKYVLLTTFKKDGTSVPTPVWSVVDDGVIHLYTEEDSGKVKRIGNDPRVTVSGCSVRGKPTGPTYAATAKVLTGDASEQTRRRIESRFRSARVLYAVMRLRPRKGLGSTGLTVTASPVVDLPGND